MSDTKALIKKRASIKAKLTQFSAFLLISKTCERLSDVQVIEVEHRLNLIETLYEKYDALQMDLEALVDDPSEQYAEREEFEKQYYGLVASARHLISSVRSRRTDSEVDVSCSNHTHKQNTIRLPKIDLPKFSGSYQDWLEFRDTFTSIIHKNDSIDKINKLHYLRASLKGSASLVVDNLDFRSENYDAAWKLLCDRYDNKRLLVNNHVQALFNIQPIKHESSKSLRYVIDTTNKNLRALSTLGQPVQHWDTLVIYIVTSKLDQVTNREWEEHRNTLTDPPTLNIFITFLSSRADLLETLEESRSSNSNYSTHSVGTKSKSFLTHTEDKSTQISCPLCQQNHFIFSCKDFRSLSPQDRLKKVNSYKICVNCLKSDHDVSKCKSGHCKYCSKKHNTLLHDHDTSPNIQNIVLSANHSATSRVVLLSTALVEVLDDRGNHRQARILLDNGSTANFISEGFVPEERACEQSFVDTTTRNPDGRFVVNIPLKESPDVLAVVQKCRRVVEILHSAQYNLRKWQSNSPEIEHLKITNLQRFRRIEQLKQHFWTRFSNDYVLWLQERTKWRSSTGELKEGTLVVIKDKGLPPLMWLLGRIVRVLPGKDGIARVADIRTRKGVLRRAFNTICPLPVDTTSNVEDTSTGGVC
ncbi:uncharacterized protein LOC142984379 isoform X3 [Anticarsia gemmatalis]|uniref:uncharacterized protein LOC142973574 isoform X3 n=1 Tax=Anticarsia gemmatalis TaxID=129554 RepID=UPI003F776973